MIEALAFDRAAEDAGFNDADHPRAENGQFGAGSTAHVVHSAKHDDEKGWQSQVHSIHKTEAGAKQALSSQITSAYKKMRAADIKENGGESDYPEHPSLEDAWGYLGGEDNRHVFGSTAFTVGDDGAPDSELSVVHEAHKDDNGDGTSEIHGAYASAADADEIANDVSEEVWADHGEKRGDERSERELHDVMQAHNAAHPEEHHVDHDLEFKTNGGLEDVADDWNDEHNEEDHVEHNASSLGGNSFKLKNKPSYLSHFRKGAGNETETEAQYFARSEQAQALEAEINAEINETYTDARDRQAAKAALHERLEKMYPEDGVKKHPGLKKANAHFSGESDGFEDRGRTGVVETSRHKIEE